jgi:Flp pilus assembly protein TadD
MGIAESLVAEGRPAEAIPVFEKLLVFWPNNAGLLVDLANASAGTGDEPRAAQAIELAFRVDPVLAAKTLRKEERAA